MLNDNLLKQQTQIIQNQQQINNQQKREREFKKIKKKKETARKAKQQKDKKLEKNQKSSYCFPIKIIEFIGANSLSKKQTQQIKLSFLGKCFDSSILRNLVQKTNDIYSSMGLATTQITVPKQNVVSGNVKLKIIEGKIEDIIFDNDKIRRLNAEIH